MNHYEVTAVSVTINAGVVELSQNQAHRRRHLLKKVGDSLYEVISPIQFKAGEEFGYGGDVNKLLMTEITPIMKEPAEAPASEEKGKKASPKGKK